MLLIRFPVLSKYSLILAYSVAATEDIRESLIHANYNVSKIKIYVTGEEKIASVESGEIIIATNIAGRGTDIETSKEVEEHGGLFVCLSFLPSNLRVERQALGRTARKGNQGSGQLIINDARERLKLTRVIPRNGVVTIEDFKAWRDDAESVRLTDIKEHRITKITADDLLFSQFNHLTNELRYASDQADKLTENKLANLEERWGFWLKELEHGSKQAYFTDFKNKITSLYQSNKIINNPVYLTIAGL